MIKEHLDLVSAALIALSIAMYWLWSAQVKLACVLFVL